MGMKDSPQPGVHQWVSCAGWGYPFQHCMRMPVSPTIIKNFMYSVKKLLLSQPKSLIFPQPHQHFYWQTLNSADLKLWSSISLWFQFPFPIDWNIPAAKHLCIYLLVICMSSLEKCGKSGYLHAKEWTEHLLCNIHRDQQNTYYRLWCKA